VKCTVYESFWPSTATSRRLPCKWRHFRVISGHVRSRDIFCRVTASSCELQLYRKWHVRYTWVFGLLQPLPGDFRSNDFTFGSLPVTWGNVTASSCKLHPCRKWNVQYMRVFGLLQRPQVTSGQITSLPSHLLSPEVTWLHILSVTASACELLPCRKWNVQYTRVLAFYSHFQLTSGQITSLPVTWGHVTSFPVTLLPPPVSYSLVGSKMCSIREILPSTATSRWLPVKWRHFRITSVHLRSRDIIFCHMTASSCELQPCKK